MEKYVEIRITAHKLCDSSHNFMDRGIKRGKAAHRYQRTAGDGKGECGFTVILVAVKRNLLSCIQQKRRLGERLFCIIIILFRKGESMKLFLGEICHTKQDYHLLAYSIQKTFRLNMAGSWKNVWKLDFLYTNCVISISMMLKST